MIKTCSRTFSLIHTFSRLIMQACSQALNRACSQCWSLNTLPIESLNRRWKTKWTARSQKPSECFYRWNGRLSFMWNSTVICCNISLIVVFCPLRLAGSWWIVSWKVHSRWLYTKDAESRNLAERITTTYLMLFAFISYYIYSYHVDNRSKNIYQ